MVDDGGAHPGYPEYASSGNIGDWLLEKVVVAGAKSHAPKKVAG